jgi:hypothetical protein
LLSPSLNDRDKEREGAPAPSPSKVLGLSTAAMLARLRYWRLIKALHEPRRPR